MNKKLEDVDIPELNEAYQKMMYWFFSYPNREIGLNDLSEELQISKTTAKKLVEIMEKEEFLIKKIYGKAWRIICNQSHPYNQSRKVAFNLSMVYEAYNRGLKEHILNIVGNAKAISLFGSYRRGDDNDESDVDIAVEVEDNEELRILELGKIPNFGYRENVSINLHIFSRNKVDINLFSNIANGIVLEGFLEVRQWDTKDLTGKTH